MAKPDIRSKILKERGITTFQPSPRKHKRFKPLIEVIDEGKSKTPLMRYLEEKYGQPIEVMLLSGSLSVVSKKLGGEVDVSTISKWIKKLKLRYSEDNLPSCEGCIHHQPFCELGVCALLIDLELWELVPLKKEEVLNG